MSCANIAEAVESFDAYVGERGGELLAVGLLARWAGTADQQQGRHGDGRVAREVNVVVPPDRKHTAEERHGAPRDLRA